MMALHRDNTRKRGILGALIWRSNRGYARCLACVNNVGLFTCSCFVFVFFCFFAAVKPRLNWRRLSGWTESARCFMLFWYYVINKKGIDHTVDEKWSIFLEPGITANELKLKNSSDSKHFGCSLFHIFVFGITNIYFALVCLHHVIAWAQDRAEV